MTGPTPESSRRIEASLELPAALHSPREARRFISRLCGAGGISADVCDLVSLLTSELVTNAVLHGRSSVRLDVSAPSGRLRIEVGDSDPGQPELRPPDNDALGGRGLEIVDSLAGSWGVRPDGRGKVVWFEVALDQP